MSPSDLTTFDGKRDARKFSFLYENMIIKNKADEEKADNLGTNLFGRAFDYYFDNFTANNATTPTAMDYVLTKRLILYRFSPIGDTA